MNIFYLDKDPKIAAQMHCDKHCVKMILEYAQLLSTAHRILDEDSVKSDKFYQVTHKNHPSAIWTRESKDHYLWLYDLFLNLCYEYSKRYSKNHNTKSTIGESLMMLPKNIKNNGWIDPPQCMPDYCKKKDTVDAYRKFYLEEKASFATWKIQQPEWWLE